MYRHVCVCVCIWEKERCSRATIRVRSFVRLLFINDSLKNNRYSWRQSLCDVQSTPVCLTGFIIVSIRALALFEYFNNERYSVVGTGEVLFAVVCIYISQNTHTTLVQVHTVCICIYILSLLYTSLKSNVRCNEQTITSNEGISTYPLWGCSLRERAVIHV